MTNTPNETPPSSGRLPDATCSARSRFRFLETLDSLTEAQRRHLLRIETSDEIASLYAVAVNDYGYNAPATHTLASVLGVRIARGWPNAQGLAQMPAPKDSESSTDA